MRFDRDDLLAHRQRLAVEPLAYGQRERLIERHRRAVAADVAVGVERAAPGARAIRRRVVRRVARRVARRVRARLARLAPLLYRGRSMVKAPSVAGQSSPSQPPHVAIFGPRLLYALWRSHGATPLALGG